MCLCPNVGGGSAGSSQELHSAEGTPCEEKRKRPPPSPSPPSSTSPPAPLILPVPPSALHLLRPRRGPRRQRIAAPGAGAKTGRGGTPSPRRRGWSHVGRTAGTTGRATPPSFPPVLHPSSLHGSPLLLLIVPHNALSCHGNPQYGIVTPLTGRIVQNNASVTGHLSIWHLFPAPMVQHNGLMATPPHLSGVMAPLQYVTLPSWHPLSALMVQHKAPSYGTSPLHCHGTPSCPLSGADGAKCLSFPCFRIASHHVMPSRHFCPR